METKARANLEPSRFVPFCKWRTEEGRDVLELHLQGFKREQLRVRINSGGGLTICGESPTTLGSFHKETKIPIDCNADEIRAKFASGILYITMPKKHDEGKPKQESSQSNVGDDSDNNTSERHKYWLEGAVSRLGISRKMAVRVAVAVVILMIVGSFVTFKYCQKSGHHVQILPENVQQPE